MARNPGFASVWLKLFWSFIRWDKRLGTRILVLQGWYQLMKDQRHLWILYSFHIFADREASFRCQLKNSNTNDCNRNDGNKSGHSKNDCTAWTGGVRPWITDISAASCISPWTARWQACGQHPAHRLLHNAFFDLACESVTIGLQRLGWNDWAAVIGLRIGYPPPILFTAVILPAQSCAMPLMSKRGQRKLLLRCRCARTKASK